jgi:hypothetical protein
MGGDRGGCFLMKITSVRPQNMAVVVIGVLMVLLCCRKAMADSAEYLAELQFLGDDEFFAAQVVELSVKVTNHGFLIWPSVASDPSHPVRMSYHWIDANGKVVTHDGLRTELPHELGMGESLLMRVSILAPAVPGTYTLVLDLVREHVTWFANRGSPPLKISAVVVQRAGGLTWQRGRILFIVAGTFLLLFLMGVGPTRLLAPDIPVALSPLLGVAAIVALSYYVSLLGLSMTRAKWGILALGVGTTVAAMVIRKSAVQPRRRESVWLILLTVVMLLVALLPLWDFGRPSSVQNTYASFFVAMSKYWQSHSLHEQPALDPYQPLDYLVRERILHHYVDAPPFLNALIASIFDVDSYETYGILTALLLAMLPATLYWVARTAFGMSSWSSGLGASLVLFNITYHRWSFQGQLTFISGLLFLILAIGAGAVVFEKRGRVVFGALSLSTLLALYPALFPYALAPLICYGCLLLWQKTLSLRALGLTLLKVLGLLIVINPVIMYYLAVSGISAAAQMREDWRNIPSYPAITELLGLLPHFSTENGGSPLKSLAFGFVPAIVGTLGYGLYRAWKEGRWLILATITPYLFGTLVIAVLIDYAYGYYKHGVVTLFVLLLTFAYGLEGLCSKGGYWRRVIPVLGGGIFLCLNFLAFQATFALEKPIFVPSKLASVGEVKRLIRNGEIVFIDAEEMSLQLWTSYFLWGIPLSVLPTYEPGGWWGFSSVFGRGDPLRFYHPQVTYTLTKRDEVIRPRPEPIWYNAAYFLHSGPPVLSVSQGWHGLEGGPPASRWMAQEGTLRLLRHDGLRKSVRIRMTLVPIVAPLTLEVFWGEVQPEAFIADDTSRPATFLTRKFSLHQGATLTIRSPAGCFEPSRLFGSPDHRCLSAKFLEVSLIDADQ